MWGNISASSRKLTVPTVISRLTVILVLCSVACRSPEDRTSGVRWEYQWDTDDPVGRIVEKNSQIGLPKHGAIVFPPTLGPDGAVYLRRPHEYTEPKGDSLVATGNNFWELRPSGGLCISPAIADDGTILLGTEDGSVWAVSPGGKKKWTYGFPEATYFPAVDFGGGYSAQAHSPGCSQPAIAVDGTSYWVGHGVYALTKDGLPRWAFEPGEDFVFVCIGADGTIYALANGAIFAITPDGKQQWEFTVEKTKYFAGEIALGSDGTLYVTLMNSHFALLLLTPHGGVKRHYESSSSDVFAVPGQTLIAPDGTVYVTKNSENRTFVVAIDSNGGSNGLVRKGAIHLR